MTSTKIMSTFRSDGGLTVMCRNTQLDGDTSLKSLPYSLDFQPGGLFVSQNEFPNNTSRWDIGFKNPPLVLEAQNRKFTIKALNKKGQFILNWIGESLGKLPPWLSCFEIEPTEIHGKIRKHKGFITEENRLYNPTILNLVRYLRNLFGSSESDAFFGWYGAFGYDVAFQFEELENFQNRCNERDLILYLPDELYVTDRIKGMSSKLQYDFCTPKDVWSEVDGQEENINLGTFSIKHSRVPFTVESDSHLLIDGYECNSIDSGEFLKRVKDVQELFQVGEIQQCSLSQQITQKFKRAPSILFKQLLKDQPSPYSCFLNLSGGEFLIGSSPQMFVRVTGSRVESRPQGITESDHHRKLLTLTTEVDINDKARICYPGSVQVHSISKDSQGINEFCPVEGQIKEEYDSIDAFASHFWTTRVTGIPKKRAMEYIELVEEEPRRWFGGAIGMVGMNGDINTASTLNTIHLEGGFAKIKSAVTLSNHSHPLSSRDAILQQADPLLQVLNKISKKNNRTEELTHIFTPDKSKWKITTGMGHHVLVIDFEDSSVHTISSCLQETGAKVTSVKYYHVDNLVKTSDYSLVVFSSGPNQPKKYPMTKLIARFLREKKTIFGINLGHQALIEYFGGYTGILPQPVCAEETEVNLHQPSKIFRGMGNKITVVRNHLFYTPIATKNVPESLQITAEYGGMVMAFSHKQLPVHGIQFQLDSIKCNHDQAIQLLSNLFRTVRPIP
jgi:anthranilate synthase